MARRRKLLTAQGKGGAAGKEDTKGGAGEKRSTLSAPSRCWAGKNNIGIQRLRVEGPKRARARRRKEKHGREKEKKVLRNSSR